jgi:4,5-DOPA dioxygenase extradiol
MMLLNESAVPEFDGTVGGACRIAFYPEIANINGDISVLKPSGRAKFLNNYAMLKMPCLFVGHGSPMNAIENNRFTLEWQRVAASIPIPNVILCISAHWLTKGAYVTHAQHPKTIHDFGGFPQKLFDVQYPAPGSPEFAEDLRNLVKEPEIGLDNEWGLDHGTWSILSKMYPAAKIPVVQLSIDYSKPPQFHYDLGKQLQSLRQQAVLIIGSGNMVHNLGRVAFDKMDEPFGYDWALEMDDFCQKNILSGNHQALIDYKKFGKPALLSVPTPDHYYPLLYTLGLQEKGEAVALFNAGPVAGSLTMTSVIIGKMQQANSENNN